MEELDILKEEEKEAMKALSNIKQKIRDYWLNKHKENFGVYIGAVVVLKDGKKAVVDSVKAEQTYGGKPWITGRVEKKDGSFGKATRNLYSGWDILST